MERICHVRSIVVIPLASLILSGGPDFGSGVIY
jgi:hypothetical protein